MFTTSEKDLLEKGTFAFICGGDQSRDSVGRQHHLKYLGSVAYSEVKGETDFLLVLLSSPLFFF